MHQAPPRLPASQAGGSLHHLAHAASAFYGSGFDSAASLVVDGCGTFRRFPDIEDFPEKDKFAYFETVFGLTLLGFSDVKLGHVALKNTLYTTTKGESYCSEKNTKITNLPLYC